MFQPLFPTSERLASGLRQGANSRRGFVEVLGDRGGRAANRAVRAAAPG